MKAAFEKACQHKVNTPLFGMETERFLTERSSGRTVPYLDFLENAPIIVRPGAEGETFSKEKIGEFMQDHILSEAEITHLRFVVFPFIRIKDFLEIRVADSMPVPEACAYFLIIKGLYLSGSNPGSYLEECLSDENPDIFDTFERIRKQGGETLLGKSRLREHAAALAELAAGNLQGSERSCLASFCPVSGKMPDSAFFRKNVIEWFKKKTMYDKILADLRIRKE